jgi:hypothetical protein
VQLSGTSCPANYAWRGENRKLVSSTSVDYLMYSGYVMMGYFWALQAQKSAALIESGKGKKSNNFYTLKIQTAKFDFDRLLPRASVHKKSAVSSTKSLMQMDNEHFNFI